MTRRARRTHTGFQGEGGAGALKSEKTLAEVVQQYDLHANQITAWKAQLTVRAAGAFGAGSSAVQTAPAVDVMRLHAKIGALAVENDFLSDALSKAGLLSAKR